MNDPVKPFYIPVRVYYEDTDSGGVVYYANYLKFMERARTEYLRRLGFEQDDLARDEAVIFAVRSVMIDYILPARFNDQLQVSASVIEQGRASLVFYQEVIKEASQMVLCKGTIKIASLDSSTFRPKSIPKKILLELNDVG